MSEISIGLMITPILIMGGVLIVLCFMAVFGKDTQFKSDSPIMFNVFVVSICLFIVGLILTIFIK